MVNYSYSIYYNAISLLIKESLYLPLFAKYAPALGTSRFCIILKISILQNFVFLNLQIWSPFGHLF